MTLLSTLSRDTYILGISYSIPVQVPMIAKEEVSWNGKYQSRLRGPEGEVFREKEMTKKRKCSETKKRPKI